MLDLEKDKRGGCFKTHQNSAKVLKENIGNLDLVDIWRVLNPESIRFTWRRRNPKIECRLDFFLVSQGIANNTNQAGICPGYKTDHSMITLRISLHSNPRRPGFWKLNTSLLTETDYVNQIKRTIQETQDDYKDDDSVNPSLLWEVIKMKVREKSPRYSAKRNNQRKHRETEIEQTIARSEEQIDKTTDTQSSHLEEQLYEQKNKLEKMIEFHTKGAILRSKARWYNEGEKTQNTF